MEILGSPVVELELTSTQPVAQVAVRLSDTAPDDQATRVTYGLLNLTHRNGSEHPEPLDAGETYRVRVELNDIAHSFPAGHRIRLAISTSYWPLSWLPPQSTRLTILTGESALHVPVRPAQAEDERIAFPPPEASPPPSTTTLETGEHNWLVTRDLALDRSTLEVVNDSGRQHIDDIDLALEQRTWESYSTQANDFNSARGEVTTVLGLERDGWRVRTITRTVLESDLTHFKLTAELDAYEDGRRVFSENWYKEIPRDLV